MSPTGCYLRERSFGSIKAQIGEKANAYNFTSLCKSMA